MQPQNQTPQSKSQLKLRLSESDTKKNSEGEAAKPYVFDPEELNAEGNLWDVWVQARRLPESKLNAGLSAAAALLLTAYVIFTPEATEDLARRVRELCDFGINFAGALLGFLIAGFTIFATLVRPSLFLTMAKVMDKKVGMNYLKKHFFRFMKMFIVIFFVIFVCTIVKMFAPQNGALTLAIDAIWHEEGTRSQIKTELARIGIVIIESLFFYLVVLLQSFIFNIYAAIMTSLRWEADRPDSSK